VRAGAVSAGQVADVHGEQDGAIYQQVTLGRSDIAPVSLLAEDGADVLERRISGKHGDHSSHLHLRHTARDTGRSWALVLSVGLPDCPTQDQLAHAHLHDLGHIHATTLGLSVVPVHVVAAPPGHADPAEGASEQQRRFARPDRAGPPAVDQRWKAALNAFDITSDGRLSGGRK
jgi:hypothetical protein